MDGQTLTALLVGLGALLTSSAGVVQQLRRTDPENVKALQNRVESAERRATAAEENVERLRTQLLTTEAELFNVRQVLSAHGWTSEVGGP